MYTLLNRCENDCQFSFSHWSYHSYICKKHCVIERRQACHCFVGLYQVMFLWCSRWHRYCWNIYSNCALVRIHICLKKLSAAQSEVRRSGRLQWSNSILKTWSLGEYIAEEFGFYWREDKIYSSCRGYVFFVLTCRLRIVPCVGKVAASCRGPVSRRLNNISFASMHVGTQVSST